MAATRPLCHICNEPHGKYKCTRCSYFTCSVPCFREHRDNHPPVDDTRRPESKDASRSPKAATRDAKISDSQNGDDSTPNSSSIGPYAGLADLPEYRMLMKRYPRLPTLLWGIATATDPPAGGHSFKPPRFPGSGNTNGFKKDKEPWTQEKGVQNAVHVLRKTRNAPGDDSDALREFTELVRLFKARKEAQAAAPVFRKKYTRDSAALISQLMRAEKPGVM